MIFSNKVYKLASGKNVSLYAENDKTMSMFFYNDKPCKRKILFSEIVRCVKTKEPQPEGTYIKKINDSHLFVCKDEIVAVIDEEN